MMQHNTIESLLEDGDLASAQAAQVSRVKASPEDAGARMLLAELLCLGGQFERAEAQLALLAQQDVSIPVAVAKMRHHVRGAMARVAWFETGAVPALIAGPTPLQRLAIELALAVRDGNGPAATAALAAAEEARPVRPGTVDGEAFDDLRDADDTSAYFLDVITGDGGYIWVEWSEVLGLRFQPPQRPIDLLWRETRLALRDGRVADVMVPAQYVAAEASPAHRLAQVTDWTDRAGGTVSGIGQRTWIVGEGARDILELKEIRFT